MSLTWPTLRNSKGEIVAFLRDGRVIAQGQGDYYIVDNDIGQQLGGLNVRVPDLRRIDYVLNVQFYTTPLTNILSHAPMNKKISGNVVGMSLYYIVAGTTLTIEVIAVGPP